MTRQTKNFREHKTLFEGLGVTIEDIEIARTNHIKFRVEYLGNKRIFVAPSSPSDVRGIKNFKSSITNWIKGVNHD